MFFFFWGLSFYKFLHPHLPRDPETNQPFSFVSLPGCQGGWVKQTQDIHLGDQRSCLFTVSVTHLRQLKLPNTCSYLHHKDNVFSNPNQVVVLPEPKLNRNVIIFP